MTQTRSLLACCMLALACTTAFAERVRPGQQPESEVPGLLHNAGGKPSFLPETLLRQRPLEELLPPLRSAKLRNHLATQRTPNLYCQLGKCPFPLCEQITESPIEGGPVPLARLHELINSEGVAVIARVTGVFPGWSTTSGVAELAELEVLEILGPADAGPVKDVGPVTVGSTLRVITQGGRLTYEKVVLCAPSKETWHRPVAGDRLLLIGSPEPSQPPGYFADWMRFELKGDEVVLQAEKASGRFIQKLPLSSIVDGLTRPQKDVR